ncbi:uncharacterized protein LOC131075965 [Cryptomeria japonica]|uniref:uncharacterized protein LOC131075965 n=1 Tax=Cryptomeria japonica TaxID=3369 RepID=UPI0025ACD28E|nr:uncharacterized protein LOC131075965 [Cryptomeria japonica]XP_057868949.1 uncharacterized protein LOC131075965 [Cryptomeria japonica]XP_057868950.1 uncharacterized protein LOC131075965 [Cryptomeria japonica]
MDMGLSENCNGRKRAAEEEEFVQDDAYKRPCRSAGREYEYGLYEALVSSDDKKMGMDNNIESLIESDDLFIYNGADNRAFITTDEHLIINGDLGRASIRSPRDDQANCGLGYGKNLSNDLVKDSDDVGRFSEVGISSYESENPLEGLDLFFDDVSLDFGVPEDHDTRDSPIVGDKHAGKDSESDLICNEDVWAAAASNVNTTEQAFVEENEVHDWLFSSDQADPSLGYGISDLLEPSITPLLKGMAGS